MRKFAKMSTTEEKINGVEIVDCDDESKSEEEFEKQAETDAATENEQNGGNAMDAEKEEETEATENGEAEEPKKGKRGRKSKGTASPKAKKTPTKSKPKKKVKLAVSDEEEEEEEEYEVQDIIDHRTEGKKVFYQIRWKGYGPSGDTWEAEASLACPDIIKRYKAKTKSATKVAPKRGAPAAKGKPAGKGKSPAKKAKKAVAVESEAEEEESEAEYEVEKIVEMNQKKNGKRDFLVHWKGFSSREDTWEPEDNLNCKDLIKKYLEQTKVAKTASPKVSKAATKRASAPKDGRRASRRNDSKERVNYFECD